MRPRQERRERAVDQDVHPSEASPHLIEQRDDLVLAAHVALNGQRRFRITHARSEHLGCFVEPGLVDVNQHNSRSEACEPDAYSLADTAAGARNHRDTVLEREHREVLRRLGAQFLLT